MTMGERVVSLVVTLAIPLLIWLFLYYLATYRRVAMKPLRPWLLVTSIALFAVSLFYDVGNNPRVSNLLRVGAWSAWTTFFG